LYFQLPYLPEETCFRQDGSSAVEGTSRPVTISEKIPAPLYAGKGPEYWPWAQISNHGRARIQALLLYLKLFILEATSIHIWATTIFTYVWVCIIEV